MKKPNKKAQAKRQTRFGRHEKAMLSGAFSSERPRGPRIGPASDNRTAGVQLDDVRPQPRTRATRDNGEKDKLDSHVAGTRTGAAHPPAATDGCPRCRLPHRAPPHAQRLFKFGHHGLCRLSPGPLAHGPRI
ncbi:hypothetical protein TW95_gp1580 [Pandoravirus inopinatum]|uniref:Uncharacterized protein n=1 Tax=Pandoravirus inopinatum TaxID=1605721 RepID=A0A0B5J3Y1_9VIRU|nr:hypothetical protein TW95_gp1580 [Pandoravirus inopinatum]AJF98314.1 hypothetical protein [Pandoravirus inopinatum]